MLTRIRRDHRDSGPVCDAPVSILALWPISKQSIRFDTADYPIEQLTAHFECAPSASFVYELAAKRCYSHACPGCNYAAAPPCLAALRSSVTNESTTIPRRAIERLPGRCRFRFYIRIRGT